VRVLTLAFASRGIDWSADKRGQRRTLTHSAQKIRDGQGRLGVFPERGLVGWNDALTRGRGKERDHATKGGDCRRARRESSKFRRVVCNAM